MTAPEPFMIGCLTVKHFPAWALSLVRTGRDGAAGGGAGLAPSRPLAVQEADRVIALNAAAQEAGIEMGMTAARAAALCPEATIRVRDFAAEHCAWEYVTGRLHRITPFLESTPPVAWFTAEAHEVLGCARRLGASVGFADHRETARLASLLAGSGKVLRVAEGQEEAFLHAFPSPLLADLGFGERTTEGLGLIGCDTLGHALRLTKRHLTLAFGDEGARLYGLLHPDDTRPVELFRPPPCIRRTFRLHTPCREPADLLPIVARLVDRACKQLESRVTGQVRIILHPEFGRTIHASRVLPCLTARRDTIGRFAERLAGDVLQQLHRRGFSGRRTAADTVILAGSRETPERSDIGMKPARENTGWNGDEAGAPDVDIERVDLVLAGLMTADAVQTSLFGEKQRLVGDAIRSVHRKQPGTLKRALIRHGAHFHEDRVHWMVRDP